MADNWMLGETAALDDYIPTPPTNYLGNAATAVKDWYAAQPSWLDRAKAENQKTTEAFQRGGMGEIAKQLATDTTEAQDLVSAFGVGNIKGVGGKVLAPGALAATSEYRPPFYSAVEQAVQGAKQNAAPGQQWAGFLRNQPGVKPEEVEALKLGKLFEQPGSVPKEAVLGEIAANRVNVRDVIKSDALDMRQYSGKLEAGAQEHFSTNYDNLSENQQAVVRKLALGDQGYSPTKFSQYTLPGGENYREMLLTLPPKVEHAPVYDLIDRNGRLIQGGVYREDLTARLAENPGATSRPSPGYIQSERGPSDVFRSSHFDEPNVLAHVRYNDRVIDGKKTLFVEEVQSDWHQKGKREGYSGGIKPGYEIRKSGDTWEVLRDGRVMAVHGSENAARIDASAIGVPDAPFKTTWPELAMKRIIREAAEKGYDKVAWTPGSVQAERYDLSKHIDMLKWYRDGDGYRVSASKDGNFVLQKSSMSERELADTVGKDMAEKIAKNQEQHGSMTGLDLKVGGEGMKGFYDEILPATVNKLVKKHGGRVEQTDMPVGSSGWTTRRAPDGQWMLYHPSSDFDASLRFPTREAAEASLLHGSHSVHTLDITPSLRAAAMKGFPLFTAGGVAATGVMGEMARQDEYR